MEKRTSADFFIDLADWQAYLAETLLECSEGQAAELLRVLFQSFRLPLEIAATPFRNTLNESGPYPGDPAIEQRIENCIRWNAYAMVCQGFDKKEGLGGHASTYAAVATAFEVGFNHHFRKGDLLFIQGHASPGVYARAYLEGRLDEQSLKFFRQETLGGVSSYPHPRGLPKNFWEVPSVSMGLGASFAVGQARFWTYLENRKLALANSDKVWCFIGDGELSEPEIMGSALIAGQDKLANLVFIVNCNLQRLDGPVRGNSKIIQDMEMAFAGHGFEVIKVVWSGAWDALLADSQGGDALQRRLDALPDGEFQRMPNATGGEIRHLLLHDAPPADAADIVRLLERISDENLKHLFVGERGGCDRQKIHAAYAHARGAGRPVAILLHTTKGYGLGITAGSNEAHQKKEFSADDRGAYAERLGIPISREQAEKAEFFKPNDDSQEIHYLLERRKQLGGFIPERRLLAAAGAIGQPDDAIFRVFDEGSERPRSTTMDMVKLLRKLVHDKSIGRQIAPIVPDEAQTFGMQEFFSDPKISVFNPLGMHYIPQNIGGNPYREAADGQLLQEGINEAGAVATFCASGTSDAVRGVVTVPFYLFYSQFGFQRTLDSIWAAADMLARGFLLGGIAGRTTLSGEGLQHCDGASHVLASVIPSVLSYDPAFGYEVASLVRTGWRRMYEHGERIMYYLTIYNEAYEQPARPAHVTDADIAQGLYRFRLSALPTTKGQEHLKAHLLASGSIVPEALYAAELLEALGVPTDVWSATSWCELLREAQAADTELRNKVVADSFNAEAEPMPPEPLIARLFLSEKGIAVAATDFMKLLPQTLAEWMPLPLTVLGTEGFGLSDTRSQLRHYFGISAPHIALAALVSLRKKGLVAPETVASFVRQHDKPGSNTNPFTLKF